MLRVTHYTHSLSRQPPATTKDVGCPCAADGRLRGGGQLKPAAKSMLEWSAHYVHQPMTYCSVMVLCHALFIQDSPQAAHHQPPLRKWAVQLLSVHFMSRGGVAGGLGKEIPISDIHPVGSPTPPAQPHTHWARNKHQASCCSHGTPTPQLQPRPPTTSPPPASGWRHHLPLMLSRWSSVMAGGRRLVCSEPRTAAAAGEIITAKGRSCTAAQQKAVDVTSFIHSK